MLKIATLSSLNQLWLYPHWDNNVEDSSCVFGETSENRKGWKNKREEPEEGVMLHAVLPESFSCAMVG